MTYTSHTYLGTVTRDSDGLVVAPAQGTEPEYMEFAEWCRAGGIPNVDDSRPVPPPPSIEEARKAVINQIDSLAYRARESMVAGTHPAEMASWSRKIAEAEAGGGPMLEAEAAARGIPVSVLITKVQTNAAALQTAEALLAGTAGRHRDSVQALTTVEEVLAYDFTSGWPS